MNCAQAGVNLIKTTNARCSKESSRRWKLYVETEVEMGRPRCYRDKPKLSSARGYISQPGNKTGGLGTQFKDQTKATSEYGHELARRWMATEPEAHFIDQHPKRKFKYILHPVSWTHKKVELLYVSKPKSRQCMFKTEILL